VSSCKPGTSILNNQFSLKFIECGGWVKKQALTVNVQPKVIRSFLRGKLSPGQSQEIQEEMLAAGIPL